MPKTIDLFLETFCKAAGHIIASYQHLTTMLEGIQPVTPPVIVRLAMLASYVYVF
jgi:hypothetical protein